MTEIPEARRVLQALAAHNLSLAVAESDTGGLLLAALTAEPGSSAVVRGGVVAYDDALKRGLLGVEASVLEQHGAVSAATAEAMAVGVKRVSGASIGVATTGIAGPGGGRPGKPVGLAFVAGVSGERSVVRRYVWAGDRAANRQHSAAAACRLVLDLVAA